MLVKMPMKTEWLMATDINQPNRSLSPKRKSIMKTILRTNPNINKNPVFMLKTKTPTINAFLAKSLAITLVCTLGLTPLVRGSGATSVRIPVHWVLIPGSEPNCDQLNPGVTSVTGDGEQHFTFTLLKNKDGSVSMRVQSNATGTAVDNNGNTYSWAYVNHLSFAVSTNIGHFTDRFDLISRGKAPNYKVFLNWDVIIDPNHPPQELPFFSTFVQGTTEGSPFCDPI
jgi:hypothetical protein